MQCNKLFAMHLPDRFDGLEGGLAIRRSVVWKRQNVKCLDFSSGWKNQRHINEAEAGELTKIFLGIRWGKAEFMSSGRLEIRAFLRMVIHRLEFFSVLKMDVR